MADTPGYVSNAVLAASLSALVDRWNTRENQMLALLTQETGTVIVTDGVNENHTLPSFPQLQADSVALTDDLTGAVAQAQAINSQTLSFSVDASASASASLTSEEDAAASAAAAAVSAAEAVVSADASLASQTAAAGSATGASGSATAASGSATAAATSATTANTAKVAAETARDSATASAAAAAPVLTLLASESVNVMSYIPAGLHAAIRARTNTDDLTTYFQQATDAAAAIRRDVHTPSGLYHFTSISMPAYFTLRGDGQSLVTLRRHVSATLTTPMFTTAPAAIDSTSSARMGSGGGLYGVTVDGNGGSIAYPSWLQNPNTLAAIADPQNDYFANGGKIGNPAYALDRDGLCLSQNPPSGATLTLNGVLAGSMATAVRRVTVYAANDTSARTFTITGTAYDGTVISEAIAGPTAGASVITTKVFKTVTSVVVNATVSAGLVEVGVTAFDIFGTIAEGRRNASSVSGYLVSCIKTTDFRIDRCTFINHQGPVISEGGGLNFRVSKCHFEDIGRSDGPFPAIWTQSYGNPAAPPVYFQDSENIIVEDCTAKNLRRLFAIFAPTKGGVLRDCRIDGYKEAAIFANTDYLNMNGGRTVIARNHIVNGVVSDIVSHAIEYTGAKRVDIIGNYIENNNHNGISAEGMQDCTIVGNTFKNVGGGFTYPYGPFSERYSFGAGAAPVAGTVVALVDTNYISIGSIGATGNNNVRIADNKFIETRGTYPPLFKQTKSGTNFLGKNVVIEDNNLSTPAAMVFLDKSITNVWDTEMSLFIRNNTGHVSEGAVILSYSFTSAAGLIAVPFTCGFRPSRIEVIAARTGLANENRTWDGIGAWRRPAAGSVANSVNGRATTVGSAARVVLITDNKFIRLCDPAGTATSDILMTSWQEDGFTVTVSAIADTTIAARIICYP